MHVKNTFDNFCMNPVWLSRSDLSASKSSPVVSLLAEPLHEAEAVCGAAQFVLREQHVGHHLDLCRARLPRRRQPDVWEGPHRHSIYSQRTVRRKKDFIKDVLVTVAFSDPQIETTRTHLPNLYLFQWQLWTLDNRDNLSNTITPGKKWKMNSASPLLSNTT